MDGSRTRQSVRSVWAEEAISARYGTTTKRGEAKRGKARQRGRARGRFGREREWWRRWQRRVRKECVKWDARLVGMGGSKLGDLGRFWLGTGGNLGGRPALQPLTGTGRNERRKQCNECAGEPNVEELRENGPEKRTMDCLGLSGFGWVCLGLSRLSGWVVVHSLVPLDPALSLLWGSEA